jgi:hypothetical protein
VLAVWVLTSCGGPAEPKDPAVRARLGETQRVVDIVSRAISYPRQDSADGFARAANATTAAQDGRLSVVAKSDLRPKDLQDALARLTFRVHLGESQAGLGTTPAITACYRADFNRYGVIGSPRRVDCPPDAEPVVVPPAPAQPEVPTGADRAVGLALRRAGAAPVRDALLADIERRVSALITDPGKSLPPDVTVTVQGSDLAVALTGDGDCLLGRRVAGRVQVWYPPAVTVQPGELSCSPETALAGQAMSAPH